ncbi:MAG: nucleoside-diphosphate sugar epimerase/dehydratase [Burkholderiaceae bacterium]
MSPIRANAIDPRRLTAMAFDLASLVAAWAFCFSLAWGFQVPGSLLPTLLAGLAVVVPSYFAIFIALGLYRGIWRYASLHDLRQIGITVLLGTLLSTMILFFWSRADLIPRTTLIMHPLVVLFLMFGGRITYRWWKEQRMHAKGELDEGKPVLILGADEASFRLILQLQRIPSWRVVGVLDDAPKNQGRRVLGHRIIGRWSDLVAVAASTGAHHALLAVSHADQRTRRRAFELCESAGIKLLIIPDLGDVIAERVSYTAIRDVQVDDLLGRESVSLDTGGLRQLLTLKTVLVTGAGGSIGSELCRQIARFRPKEIILFELSEFALYEISEIMAIDFPDIRIRTIVGDIKDSRRLFDVFANHAPQVVFHAAAYKHVPLMETTNAWQAVQNNALGTVRLTEAISRFPVEKLVFISTDKAVNPTSVMGATKRLAEIHLQLWALSHPGTETVIVRFGNVLGSTGSVVPKFRRQIAMGGPITITHPDIKRYFMSVSEATQLVIQAALMGNSGDIMVLDMGDPVRIVDLAKDMIRLSGLPESAIPIQFTGLRPGEKLFEELLANGEATRPTLHPKLRVARCGALPSHQWAVDVHAWLSDNSNLLDADVRSGLARFVPEYMPFKVPGDNVVPLRPGNAASLRASA